MVTLQTIQSIIIFVLVLFIIFFVTLFVLDQFSPFKQCKDKDDDYTVYWNKYNITCGELKTVNETIMNNEYAD